MGIRKMQTSRSYFSLSGGWFLLLLMLADMRASIAMASPFPPIPGTVIKNNVTAAGDTIAPDTTTPPSNVTDYLLSKYASNFQTATTSPSFFQQVLNGTVSSQRVAYFFEQDIIYGRGFLQLTKNTMNLLSADSTAPDSNATSMRVDNLIQTANGLEDEGAKLTNLTDQLDPGSAGQGVNPSEGTMDYV